MRKLDVAPEGMGGRGGGGGDEDPRFGSTQIRSHGFVALAFGVALGLTLAILFGVIYAFQPDIPRITEWALEGKPIFKLLLCFLYGMIAGTLISGIYNMLVFRKLNIFGLERNMD